MLLAVGMSKGVELLSKHSLLEATLIYTIEVEMFDFAFKIAKDHLPLKLNDLRMKYALYLEDNKDHEGAEKEFVAAGKYEEAIHMWIHLEDWAKAKRVPHHIITIKCPYHIISNHDHIVVIT